MRARNSNISLSRGGCSTCSVSVQLTQLVVLPDHITLGHGYDHSVGAARKAESWKASSNPCVPGEKCWAAAAAPCLQLSRVSPWAEARAPRSAVTTWEHRRAMNDPAVLETEQRCGLLLTSEP